MVLAGYEATPAEEIPAEPHDEPAPTVRRAPAPSAPVTLDSVIPFGKHKGKTVRDVGVDYFEFLRDKFAAEEGNTNQAVLKFVTEAVAACLPPSITPSPVDLSQIPPAIKSAEDEDKELDARLAGSLDRLGKAIKDKSRSAA